MFQSPGRSLAFAAALLAFVTVGPAPVTAQTPEAKPPEVKNWPKQGLSQAQLVRPATGPSSRAGRAAAASCTHHAPSA